MWRELPIGGGGTAAIRGKKVADGGEVTGLEGMLHSARAWVTME